MKLVSCITLILVLSALSRELRAENVTSFKPLSIVNALQTAGYKAVLTKSDAGDPVIDTGVAGSNVRILFADCKRGLQCSTLEFISLWECESKMKACARAAQRVNDTESPAKAINLAGQTIFVVLYYMVLDEVGITPELFLKNLGYFSFYNQEFNKFITEFD